VYDYLGERFLVAVAAQRVAVGLVDELGDRARAVAYYVTGFAVAGSYQAAAYHQHPVVVAFQLLLDYHLARHLVGTPVGSLHLGLAADAERDAAALVTVERLDDDRCAKVGEGSHGVLERVDDLTARHGYPRVSQKLLGQRLVSSYVDGDVTGLVGDSCLDQAAVAAITELHQVGVVEPA